MIRWIILAKEPDCRGDLWWRGRGWVFMFCGYGIPQAPLLGGRALINDPADHFSEGARLQERFVVEGPGVGKTVMQLCNYAIIQGP